jgi:ribosomal protein S27E
MMQNMAMAMPMTCAWCGNLHTAPDAHSGQSIECLTCGHLFPVPVTGDANAPSDFDDMLLVAA